VLSRKSKKVLIVEDNTKHARALAYFLANYHVHSEISNSIDQSIVALQKKEVDCVILDMGIPDSKAYDTLDTIKQNKELENIPIIVFTGKNISRVEEFKIKQYADSIVVKTAHSYQRILDEVSLFLHLVDEKKDTPHASALGKLGALDAVLGGKTVLIADDDIRNIFSLTKALEQHKMKILSAMDGKEALALAEKADTIDIILMDMMMPEMDGYETIARIRRDPRLKTVPVIAVTAKAMTGDREKCILAGASDYISKPVDIDQLISLLRIWLYEK
jgi:CheY-like chemotaxis protein